jgi:hypothetical protein
MIFRQFHQLHQAFVGIADMPLIKHHHEHHHHYHHSLEARCEVMRRLEAMPDQLGLILALVENTIMPTLDELQAKADATLANVTAETDLDNAIAKIVTDQNNTIIDLKAQLAAAGTDPVKLQALAETLDNILNTNTSNTKIVSDAVTANTPAA